MLSADEAARARAQQELAAEIERTIHDAAAAGHEVLPGGWVRPATAAAVLGLTARTLRNYRAQGTGPPAYRVVRDVQYHVRDLVLWRRRRRAESCGNSGPQ